MDVVEVAKSLAQVAKELLLQGEFKYATQEIAEARRAICYKCPQRKGDKCGVCTCPINRKTSLLNQTCPLEHW